MCSEWSTRLVCGPSSSAAGPCCSAETTSISTSQKQKVCASKKTASSTSTAARCSASLLLLVLVLLPSAVISVALPRSSGTDNRQQQHYEVERDDEPKTWTVAPVVPDQLPSIHDSTLLKPGPRSVLVFNSRNNKDSKFGSPGSGSGRSSSSAERQQLKNYQRIMELFEVDEKILKRSEQSENKRSTNKHRHHHHHRHHHQGNKDETNVASSMDPVAVNSDDLKSVLGGGSSGSGSGSGSGSSSVLLDGISDQYEAGQPMGSGFLDVCASVMVKEKLTETFDAEGNLVSVIQRPGQQQEIYYEKCLKPEAKCAGIDEGRFESKCEQDFGFTQMLFKRHDDHGRATGPALWGFVRVPRSCSCKIHRKQTASSELFNLMHSSSRASSSLLR